MDSSTTDVTAVRIDGTNKVSHGVKPLNVVIVGAGIGGLSAAIMLRQQGHLVTLLEQSRFANELGAAVHMAPNATGLLLRMGINAEELGAVPCKIMTQSKPDLSLIFEVPLWRQAGRWQHPWLLAHRVDLHSELKKRATMEEGLGAPAVLRTSSKVASVSTDGTVTLVTGETIQADLVVGADGVHSKTRYALSSTPADVKPFGSGKSAFRFTIPRSRALEDPDTKPLAEKEGQMNLFMGRDRRVVIYPTRNHEVLNFVCIHPTAESEQKDQTADDWQNSANLDKMLAVYKDWHPTILKILKMADEDTLKVWDLLDMAQLSTWTEGKLVLIGDSAHPFTPHQGQGAGQAIEDAASLACVLPLGTQLDEIPSRLKIYEECRYHRASRIQEYSRIAGKDLGDGPPLDTIRYTDENFGHDEWHYTTQKLRQWEWSRKPNSYLRMPIAFGPFPGPRQDHFGNPRDWSKSTFTTASIKFRTSRTLLENFFPTSEFKFVAADTNCFATFSFSTLGNLEWLGGHGYSHFGLYIHGVEHTQGFGKKRTGSFLPVLFENLADPIISGREELGMPKVYCSLDAAKVSDTWRLTAGWMGNNFLDMSLTGLKEQPATTQAQESGTSSPRVGKGLMFYKYIPKTGTLAKNDKSESDAEYLGFVEESHEALKVETTLVAEKAELKFNTLDWKRLPTLRHIIERLAEIPVYEVVEARIVQGTGGSDLRDVQRIV